ncbi:MAG TPA: hypothetical protein VHP83_23965 [Aggregatilineaceae bacterium]|nr:hypothetical protein [Aggregatilineaceae bacterium]
MAQMFEQTPDVALVRAQARAQWEKEARKKISIQERIGDSISWFIVVVAAVFFLLSAPHTMQVFAILTPFVGYIAPVGIECGQLFLAFWRKMSKAEHRIVPVGFLALEGLIFIAAIIVNGAGSFIAIVEASDQLKDKSFAKLTAEFGNLPAQSQVALFLVPFAALIIPIGASIAGESLAALFLERRDKGGGLLDEKWRQVSAEVEFMALRDAAISMGVLPHKAVKWAAQITGYDAVRLPSVTFQRTATDTIRTDTAEESGQHTGQGYSKRMDAREIGWSLLQEHPEYSTLSARQFADKAGIGKTVAAELLADYRGRVLGGRNGQRNEEGKHGGGS